MSEWLKFHFQEVGLLTTKLIMVGFVGWLISYMSDGDIRNIIKGSAILGCVQVIFEWLANTIK